MKVDHHRHVGHGGQVEVVPVRGEEHRIGPDPAQDLVLGLPLPEQLALRLRDRREVLQGEVREARHRREHLDAVRLEALHELVAAQPAPAGGERAERHEVVGEEEDSHRRRRRLRIPAGGRFSYRLGPGTMRFLVFAPESLSLPGAATSESALRTSGLVEGLRAHGHTVEVSASRAGLDPTSRVHAARPDVVICGSGTHVLFDAPLSQPLVLDLGGACGAGLDRPPADVSAALGAQLRSIAQADYFLVSGPRHRLYSLSFLLRSGVDRAETRVAIVPLPLSPDVPAHPRVRVPTGGLPAPRLPAGPPRPGRTPRTGACFGRSRRRPSGEGDR